MLGARIHELEGDEYPLWSDWLPIIQCKLVTYLEWDKYYNSACVISSADQLNTTVHGTMKTTPYELVFGQPPRHNIFPGASAVGVNEEKVQVLFDEKLPSTEQPPPNQDPLCLLSPVQKDPPLPIQDNPPSRSPPTNLTSTEQPPPNQEDPLSLSSPVQKDPPLPIPPSCSPVQKDPPSKSLPFQDNTPLGTSQKHLKLRQEADARYRANAEKMQLKYCKAKRKKVRTFSPGEYVSIRIPRIDRASTDFHRLPCVVVERLGSEYNLYRLRYVRSCVLTNKKHVCMSVMPLSTTVCMYRSKHGVLKNCYGEGDMELYEGKLDLSVDGWQSSPVLSLREAAALLNPKNVFQAGRCNCQLGCTTPQRRDSHRLS